MLLYRIMFTLRTSVLPPLSAVGAIVAILTDSNGASLTGGAVGGGQTPTYCTYTVCRDGQNILTHPDFSLCAGVSVLFSFVVLGFVAHLDDALSQIFVGPGTMRRCEKDLETCFKAEKGMVKIHWLWNRAILLFCWPRWAPSQSSRLSSSCVRLSCASSEQTSFCTRSIEPMKL